MNTTKEQLFMFLKANANDSFTIGKLKSLMKIQKTEEQVLLKSIKELTKCGVIRNSNSRKIYFNKKADYVIGKIYTNYKGFGFLIPFEEKMDDVFVPANDLKTAMHQDVVVLKITKKAFGKNRSEGTVVDVVQRHLDSVVGTFMLSTEGNFGFVIPDNKSIAKDIYVPFEKINNAKSYDKVICEIEKYPEKNRKPEGIITEVLGVSWDKGVEALSIVKDYKIKSEFPPKLLKMIDKLSDVIPDEEYKNRLDLRESVIFTIDGEDSKDLDDAISIDLFENGHYMLGVHIADVSHYVKRGSKLDEETLERATSVYLINQVVPMLPKKLSNGLCSLNPNEDKLTLTVFMEIDKLGNVLRHEIKESIINSRAKLNYTEVTKYLKGENEEFKIEHPEISKALDTMNTLALILRKKRDDRGALDFDFPESKIVLDEEDKPIEIYPYPRGISNELIQEFMLVCNETIAKYCHQKGLPFVYRIHENPREEKLNEFFKYIQRFGLMPPGADISPLFLQQVMNQFKDKPEEQMLNLLLLQSMQQAKYHPESSGHFGLATEFYCHFTSPIRRYPDLEIHRIIKDHINGKLSLDDLESRVDLVSKLASKKSRIAERAEKDYDMLKKLEYMKDHLKEAFEGVVIKVNAKGLQILLNNTVEGFLPIDKLDGETYVFIEDDYRLSSVSGKSYDLGQNVVVQVDKIDEIQKRILFATASKAH